jgi:hypothetical protein
MSWQTHLRSVVLTLAALAVAGCAQIGLGATPQPTREPGTILHGAFSSFWEVFEELTLLSTPIAVYLVGGSGLFTLLGTVVVAFWFLRRRSMDTVNLDQPVAAD